MPIAINGAGTITGISAGGLPDSCITTDDIAANAVTAAKLGADQASGLAKAWVNFNGTGTVAIRASFNVSSITDNGTGNYTVNFTTAMVDANYAWSGNACYASLHQTMVYRSDAPHTYSTTALQLMCIEQSGASDTASDASVIGIKIFR